MRLIALLALVLSPSVLPAQAPTGADSSLASELHARVQLDQAARQLITMRSQPGTQITPEDMHLITTVDSLNTAWLKGLVEMRGWPKRSEVGENGARDAWLLVQHADRDRTFQQAVLGLMERAVAEGEASGSDFAYLTDRVRTARGEPQLYGTQIRVGSGGEMEPFPIEAPERVDERRAAVGLPPLQEYLAQIKRFYGRSQ